MARMASRYGTTATPGFGGTMAGIEKEYAEARTANERRYAQAMAIYDEIIQRYQPGGTFGKGALAQLEKQKVRDVGAETQQMVSSGLYGTTTTAGLPSKWEAQVGAPARLRLEDIMMERLSQAQVGKAGFIERREDVYPDVGAYAGYAAQAGAAGGGGGAVGGGGYGGGYTGAGGPGISGLTGRAIDVTPSWGETDVSPVHGKGFFSPTAGTFPTYQAMEEAAKKKAKKPIPSYTASKTIPGTNIPMWTSVKTI